jgi:uncharacterized protein YndB with AHSA1/START domain
MSYELKVHRVMDAGAEEVFEAFTSVEAQQIWFRGPERDPNMVVEIECDPRVGGRWLQVWGPNPQETYRELCVFQVVDRPRRLAMTSEMTGPDGQVVNSHVDITFEETDGKTKVTVVHSGLPTAELRDFLSTMAWQGAFDRIEWYFAEYVKTK